MTWVRRHLGVLLPLAAFAVIVLSGASYSSLYVVGMRADVDAETTQWFEPRDIRSDEYLTQTSQELGVVARGRSFHSPLAETQDLTFQLSSGQPAESVLFWEHNLLRLGPWLPDQMVLAAVRAWPMLVLALALPPLLRRFGATTATSWLAIALTILAPTSVWWSFTPVRILSHAVLGALLLVLARERWDLARGSASRALALGLAGAGGLYFARFPTNYVPWYLTIGLPVLAAVTAYLLWQRPLRPSLLVLGVGAAVGTLLLGLTLWENWDAFTSQLATSYPGDRRASGDAMPFYSIFGGPGLYPLQAGVAPVVGNPSEVTTAYAGCLVWALFTARGGLGAVSPAARAGLVALVGATCFWLAWCTVSWGQLGLHLPVVNLVVPGRAAATVGYPAALVLAIVLGRAGRTSARAALAPAVACAAVTAYGVSSLRPIMPTLDPVDVAVIVAVVGLAVWALTRSPRTVTVLGAALLLLWPVHRVNPVLFGLGDVRGTEAAGIARRVGDRALAGGTYVVSDSQYVNALLIDNGAPTLTGWQISGPDREGWEVLDPSAQYEEAWNRGASYISLALGQRRDTLPVITAPYPDVILIDTHPCALPEAARVSVVISISEQTAGCLEPITEFDFSGQRQHVYRVTR